MEVMMTAITIALPDEYVTQLQDRAKKFGITPEELVRVSVVELLTRPEEAFKRAVDYVLKKNADLYRRLA
jgi:predicted transcriptional regulator